MSKLTETQLDHVRKAHELAREACCELVRAHQQPGPASPFKATLERSSKEVSAVCAVLAGILRQHDEEAKTERWRQKLFEQNRGVRE